MKKYIIASLAAVAMFAGAAFAASLDVTAGTLQAGQDPIEKCIEGEVEVSYGSPSLEDGVLVVNQITLDHLVGNCVGRTYDVIVTGTDDSVSWSTATVTGVFDTDPAVVMFNPPFDAQTASHVHLVIRTAPAP